MNLWWEEVEAVSTLLSSFMDFIDSALVEAAVHKAAGPRLLSECGALHGCETGQVKISRGNYWISCFALIMNSLGYDLPAKCILIYVHWNNLY